MPSPIKWTAEEDWIITAMRREGAAWATVARALGYAQLTVYDRARRIGAVVAPEPARPAWRAPRATGPLPAGSPETWGAITAGTCLDGAEYSPVVVPRFRGDSPGHG